MWSLPFVPLSLVSSVLLSIPSLPESQRPRKPPARPEAPFTVFVSAEPRGEPEIERKIRSATEVFKDAIDRNEDWFARVLSAREAEIVVEVQALFETEATSERTQTLTEGTRSHTSNYLVSQDRYVLYAKTTLFGSILEVRGPRGLKKEADAASALAKELGRQVKARYWQLADRRELFHRGSADGDEPVEELGLEWVRREIVRRVEDLGFDVQRAGWSETTLSVVIAGDEYRFPFPRSGFEPCSTNLDCQQELVARVMDSLEPALRQRK